MTSQPNSSPTLLSLVNRASITLAIALITILLLSGCASNSQKVYSSAPIQIDLDDANFGEDFEWLDVSNYQRMQKLEKMHNSNFTVVVGKVFDKRTTRSFIKSSEKDKILYEYDPDELLLGSTTYVQNQLQKYLDYGPNKPVVYVAEANITDARIRIEKGSFLNGRGGKYVVHMAFDVLVRDADSMVLGTTPVRLKYEQRRVTPGGRHLTEAQDRSRLMLAIEQAFQPAAERLAYRIYRAHLRRGGARIQ